MKKFGVVFIFLFLILSTVSGQTLKANTFGFCTSNLFLFTEGKDTSWVQHVADLNPTVLQFPGGGEGNFYHLNEAAYGYRIEEINGLNPSKLKDRMYRWQKRIEKTQVTHNYFEDFVRLAKRVDAKASLFINVLTGTIDEALSLIEQTKANNIEVVGVELGGELYAQAFRAQLPSPTAYLDLIDPFYKAIKEQYPELKIGLLSAPVSNDRYHKKWNETVATYPADACVIHLYPKLPNHLMQSGVLQEEQAIAAIERYLSNTLKEQLDYYQNLYGDSKELWVTEWNLGVSPFFGNTLLQSALTVQMLIELNKQGVTLATCHNLLAQEYMFSLINPSWRGEEGVFQTRTNHDALKMLSTLFQKSLSLKKIPLGYRFYSSSVKQHDLLLNNGADEIVTNEFGQQAMLYASSLMAGKGINYLSRMDNQFHRSAAKELSYIPFSKPKKIILAPYSINLTNY